MHFHTEFHQLANEAEDELREMEDMLALLPPPAPPKDKNSVVDTSLESVVKEMSAIEGKLVIHIPVEPHNNQLWSIS